MQPHAPYTVPPVGLCRQSVAVGRSGHRRSPFQVSRARGVLHKQKGQERHVGAIKGLTPSSVLPFFLPSLRAFFRVDLPQLRSAKISISREFLRLFAVLNFPRKIVLPVFPPRT